MPNLDPMILETNYRTLVKSTFDVWLILYKSISIEGLTTFRKIVTCVLLLTFGQNMPEYEQLLNVQSLNHRFCLYASCHWLTGCCFFLLILFYYLYLHNFDLTVSQFCRSNFKIGLTLLLANEINGIAIMY